MHKTRCFRSIDGGAKTIFRIKTVKLREGAASAAGRYSSHSTGRIEKNHTVKRVAHVVFGSVS